MLQGTCQVWGEDRLQGIRGEAFQLAVSIILAEYDDVCPLQMLIYVVKMHFSVYLYNVSS